MKFIAMMAFFLGLVNLKCLSREMPQLSKLDKVTVMFDSYHKNDRLKILESIEDPQLRFLSSFNDYLSLNLILRECVGVGTTNIGFTGRNGREYDSGLSPESIDDLVDRDAYKKALALNSENIRTKIKLHEIRKNLLGLLRITVERLDEKYQKVAASMIEKL